MRRIELSDLNARGSLQELVSTWPVPLLVTTTLAVFQQLTGQANVLNFTVDIFEASGFRGPAPAVWLGLVKVVYTIVAITYVSFNSPVDKRATSDTPVLLVLNLIRVPL